MKIGNFQITVGPNEIVITAVVGITIGLMWQAPPAGAADLFKQGFGALIAWGAGYAMGKSQSADQPKGD